MKPDNQNNNGKGGGNNKRNMTAIISLVLWALIIVTLVNYVTSVARNANTEKILYGQFLEMVENDQVEKVIMTNTKFTIYPKTVDATEGSAPSAPVNSPAADTPPPTVTPSPGIPAESAPPPGPETSFKEMFGLGTSAAPGEQPIKTYYCAPINDPNLIPLLREHGVQEFGAEYEEPLNPLLGVLLSWVLPMLLIMVIFSFLFRGMSNKMGGGLGGVGKANAKVYVEKKTGVTFKDVAGQDEAKESLEEIIDFLHNPQKYTEIGAKLPKGALLVGSPGTGKTLLAKAVAGEAQVPFFSISGSDFVEMFVGVGASRVRDLFKEASKMAPCIVFIDEIDTIGKSRDNRMGGNDEREQTLNQLLAEMDGFDPTKGVILLAATNRPEVLDKALLRPGRFDRRITVDRPNLAGRLATLQVHTRNIRMSEDVDLNKIAQATAGTVGADLANLVNEAALRAVRHGRKAVQQNDLLVSFEVVIAGTEKKGTVLTEGEKKMIAYHEVGHAMVAAKQKEAQPVSKITIVPHTQGALGYTLHLPEEEKFLMTESDILAEIRTLLAGRCAEEVVFLSKSSGAANDIERATELARKMVTMFGMSEKFGMMGLATVQSQYLDGGLGLTCGQETAAQIDQEIRTIINRCHNEATKILQDNRDMLDNVAGYLLKKETITGQELMAILEGKDPALVDNYGATPDGPPPPLGGEPATPVAQEESIPSTGEITPEGRRSTPPIAGRDDRTPKD